MCHVEDKIKAPIETIRLEKFLIELNFSNSIVSKLEITFSIIIFDMIDEKKKYPSLFWKMQVVRYETKCYWRGKKKKKKSFSMPARYTVHETLSVHSRRILA